MRLKKRRAWNKGKKKVENGKKEQKEQKEQMEQMEQMEQTEQKEEEKEKERLKEIKKTENDKAMPFAPTSSVFDLPNGYHTLLSCVQKVQHDYATINIRAPGWDKSLNDHCEHFANCSQTYFGNNGNYREGPQKDFSVLERHCLRQPDLTPEFMEEQLKKFGSITFRLPSLSALFVASNLLVYSYSCGVSVNFSF